MRIVKNIAGFVFRSIHSSLTIAGIIVQVGAMLGVAAAMTMALLLMWSDSRFGTQGMSTATAREFLGGHAVTKASGIGAASESVRYEVKPAPVEPDRPVAAQKYLVVYGVDDHGKREIDAVVIRGKDGEQAAYRVPEKYIAYFDKEPEGGVLALPPHVEEWRSRSFYYDSKSISELDWAGTATMYANTKSAFAKFLFTR